MTIAQLEQKIVRMSAAHDRALMRGDIAQEQYDGLMRELYEKQALAMHALILEQLFKSAATK